MGTKINANFIYGTAYLCLPKKTQFICKTLIWQKLLLIEKVKNSIPLY